MSTTTRVQAMRPTDIGIAGPGTWDMARDFRSIRADPLTYLSRVSAAYGDLVSFPVPGPPALLVSDPGDVRHVLQTTARSWGKKTVQYAALARVTGAGLLTSDEAPWLDHRRLAAPAFHRQRLDAVAEQVLVAADAAIADELATAHDAVVDVARLVHRIALDTVGRALFSADLSGHAQRLLDATSDAATLVVKLGRSVVPGATWAPTRTNLRLLATRRRLDSISGEVIVQRRHQGVAADGTHGDDLLGLLIDSDLSDAEIRDELVTMVIAGHETVAAALAWTLMLLGQDPAAQDRVRDEVTAATGPVSLVGHRESLPWTRAVADEALRLYPPAWALSRRSVEPVEVAGHELPTGTMVIISPWVVHRREESWPDPLTFRPERFLGAGAPDPAYLPFGHGPRLCIGRELALGEMVVVLSRLLADHVVTVPDGWRPPTAEARIAVHPAGGMPLRVRRLRRRSGA